MAIKLYCIAFILVNLAAIVWGHGYMIDPAARNACYKMFPGKCLPNYNANEQFCGGRDVQIKHGGKCGACGDEYGKNIHVYPGKYAIGFITKTYKEGQIISVKIHITANHKGWFEFRVGDIGSPPITQAKLSYLLKTPSGETRIPLTGSGSSYETIKLRLPAGLSCKQCVIQWWWEAGNTWGCDNEGCGLGHGPQETFVNCADITITSKDGVVPPTSEPTSPPPTRPRPTRPPPTRPPPTRPRPTRPRPETPAPTNPPTSPPKGTCKAKGPYKGNPKIDKYCQAQCDKGRCPTSFCECRSR